VSGPLIVTTPEELRELIREAVRAELAESGATDLPSEWVDTATAAEILGRHPKTVARMAKLGQLPAKRLGNQWRYKRVDCLAYLEQGG